MDGGRGVKRKGGRVERARRGEGFKSPGGGGVIERGEGQTFKIKNNPSQH